MLSLLVTVFAFLISRYTIYMSMKNNTNPVYVHVLLNFAVFTTLLLTILFYNKGLKNINLKKIYNWINNFYQRCNINAIIYQKIIN